MHLETFQRKNTMKRTIYLAAMTLFLFACQTDKSNNSMNQNATIETIMTRVSVRQFTSQKPTDDQIETLLRAAMAAPSAVNRQPWCFVVVDDPALLQQIGEQLPGSRVQNGAQVAIIPCGDLTKTAEGEAREFWIHDTAAATENILLAAHSLGLGAVWTAVQPVQERVQTVRQILNLPDHLIPLCIIPVGYPAEQPAVKDKFKEENIHYNRW